MTASSITSARTSTPRSAKAVTGSWRSWWRRSSSGSGQPGTGPRSPGSRALSGSGRNGGSARTTSTSWTRTSGRRSSRSAPTVRGSPGSGSTVTSGPTSGHQGRDRVHRAVQRVRVLPGARTVASCLRQLRPRARAGVLRPLDHRDPDTPERGRPGRRVLVGALDAPGRNVPHIGVRRLAPRPQLLRSARAGQHRDRPPRRSLARVRSTTAPPDTASLPDPDLHHRHRDPDRLPLQALPRQAIPQRRPRTADGNGHQPARRPRRQTSPAASPRN